MGGDLPLAEKEFIWPLLQAVYDRFRTVTNFIEYSMAHPARPTRTYLVNPGRATGRNTRNPVNFREALNSQINGSPPNFPEWWVVEWVITVVMSNSSADKRAKALADLGWDWAELRGKRPWGFHGEVPDEAALTDPDEAKDDETKLAVLQNVTVPALRYEVENLRARNEILQRGRHYLLSEDVDDVVDLTARLRLADEALAEAERDKAKAEDHAARVQRRNNELEQLNVEAHHKLEHLLGLLRPNRPASPLPMSGILDPRTATEQTEVFPAVSGHPPSVEARDSVVGTNDEIAQKRYKNTAWYTPEQQELANDSSVHTKLLEIADILNFRVPGNSRNEAIPQKHELDTPSASGQGA
ncbi:hypothetical protein ACWGE0_42955 [Lentzea sp. NPDC054927]